MKTFVLRFLMYLMTGSIITAIVFFRGASFGLPLLHHLTPENIPQFAPVVIGVVAGCSFVLAIAHGLLDVRDRKKLA
jgi:hypothetical protein